MTLSLRERAILLRGRLRLYRTFRVKLLPSIVTLVGLPRGVNYDLAWQNPNLDLDNQAQWFEDVEYLSPKVVRLFPTFHATDDPSWRWWDADLESNYDAFIERVDEILSRMDRLGARCVLILFDCTVGIKELYHGVDRHTPEFFSSPEIRDALKERFRNIVTPFARDRRVFAWEITNEPNQSMLETPEYAEAYGDFVEDLSRFLIRECGVTQPICDGMAADAVMRFCDRSKFLRILALDKHQYDCTVEEFKAMIDWELRLMDEFGWNLPIVLGEIGIKGLPDEERAAWYSEVLSYVSEKGFGALTWGVYGEPGTHTYTVNPRFMPRTAEVVRAFNRGEI